MNLSMRHQTHQRHNLFRKITILAAAFALPALAATAAPTGQPLAVMGPANAWQPLFNGTDLTGWESFIGKPLAKSNVPGAEKDAKGNYTKVLGLNNDPLHCFTVVTVDGAPAIRVSGEGTGALGTKENFSNYHLRFQFKWGEKNYAAKPTDKTPRPKGGGMIYHAHGDFGALNGIWMNALQYQLCEGSCAAFIIQGDSTGLIKTRAGGNPKKPVYDPAGQPTLISLAVPECFLPENFEKPAGEWNTFEIIALGDKVIHVLNGHVVARVENLRKGAGEKAEPLTSGHIQLQMESAEEFFRNIEIRSIDAIPAEYAEGK